MQDSGYNLLVVNILLSFGSNFFYGSSHDFSIVKLETSHKHPFASHLEAIKEVI